MPSNTPSNKPCTQPGSGSSSRRETAARAISQNRRRERRTTVLIQAVVGLVVVAIALGVTVTLLSREDGPAATPPPGLTEDGAVRFGNPDADVVLTAVEDFQCPACRSFEAAAGSLLADYRDGDEVLVEYRPMAFLDRASTTEYSSRALNASMCVLDAEGKDTWLEYHEALYAQQPAEGGPGLPDDTLVSMAAAVGADGDAVGSCITDRTYDAWVDEQTERVLDEGVNGTPTVMVNGEPTAGVDPASIEQAVAEAQR